MKKIFFVLSFLVTLLTFAQKKYILVVHGGAGTISKSYLSDEKEKEVREKLSEALKAGFAAYNKGESSTKMVEAAVVVLEDSPLFNAGKGSVFTHEGKNEMDASIMVGTKKMAGAVAGVTTIKNPIKAAVAVMNNSEHVLLSGKGAEEFAKNQKLEIVDPSYFFTQDRWDALQRMLKKENATPKITSAAQPDYLEVDSKFGTVGAVALDKNKVITAGTSTGGMTNKRWNRLGDSPIIGAGTYANQQVGISGTGWGEYFIRSTAGRTIAAKMEYQNKSVTQASQELVDEIEEMGGNGGVIALDINGNIAMPFNTEGMYRGAITEDGKIEIEIYK